jgi:hypothetical protein
MKKRCAAYVLLLVLVGLGCSSDPDTPLGSEFLEGGLIGSEPGDVFQDTVLVESGDASFVVGSYEFNSATMELGRKDEFESWPVFRVDFSTAGIDTLRVVESAHFDLQMTELEPELHALFIALADSLVDSDTLKTIMLADTIPDETLTNVDRIMKFVPDTDPHSYSLPPALVQSWIRGESPHTGIAVVLTDPTDTTRTAFHATEAGENLRPLLRVTFTTNDESRYLMAADGTYVQDLHSSSNLVLSDGKTRRILIPVDLSDFDPKTLVHDANLVLRVVPDSFVGGDFTVILYRPESADPNDPQVLDGTSVVAVAMDGEADAASFSIRNILSLMLSEGKEENALALRFAAEGSAIRRAEFYTTNAPDSLKPTFTFTYSTAPKFGK